MDDNPPVYKKVVLPFKINQQGLNTTQMRLSTTLINQRRFGTPGRVSLIHGIAFLQPRDLLKVCLTNSSGNVVDSICWHVTAKSTNIPTK